MGNIGNQVRAGMRRASERVGGWNAAMLEESKQRQGTRLRPFVASFIASGIGVVGIGAAVSQGALAASINLSDQPFIIRANQIKGTGLGAYVNRTNSATGSSQPAIRASIAQAEVDGLCAIIEYDYGLAKAYLVVTGGAPIRSDKTPTPNLPADLRIDAKNLSMEANYLLAAQSGKAQMDNAVLGIAPGSIRLPIGPDGSIVPMPTSSAYGTDAQAGGFGIQGSGVDAQGNPTQQGTIIMPGVEAKAIGGELLGSISLPDLEFRIMTKPPTYDCSRESS